MTYDGLQPRQHSWFWRLFGDTGALGNPAIEKFVDVKLGQYYHWCKREWLMPVVLAHSLGTLLVHQSLIRQPLPGVTLVTIGSPPRLRSMIGLTDRPPGVRKWINIYSPYLDLIVLAGRLSGASPVLEHADQNVRVHCRHRGVSYLCCQATQMALRGAVTPAST